MVACDDEVLEDVCSEIIEDNSDAPPVSRAGQSCRARVPKRGRITGTAWRSVQVRQPADQVVEQAGQKRWWPQLSSYVLHAPMKHLRMQALRP